MSEASSSEEVISVLKNPLFCAEWTTQIPDVGENSLSGKFLLGSIQSLFALSADEESLNLDVVATDEDSVHGKFKSTVLVETKVDLHLPAPEIRRSVDMACDYLWIYDLSNLDLTEVTGKIITFLVVLEAEDKESGQEEGNNWNETFKSFKSLSLDLGKLLGDGVYQTDIILLCEDYTIPAHGAVLSARSVVFQKMLQADMVEKRTGSIKISDVHPTVIKEFLKYIYTGTLTEMTVEMATQLYKAGDKYNVASLAKECADFLCINLNSENACEILSLADEHSDSELKKRVTRYILNRGIPLKSEQWHELSDQRPKLANEVLYLYYKITKTSNLE